MYMSSYFKLRLFYSVYGANVNMERLDASQ